MKFSRRDLLLATSAGVSSCTSPTPENRRPRIAAIITTYFPNSHCDVFFSRILEGYRLKGVSHEPKLEVVSMYADQFPPNDMARDIANEYGFPIYPTIAEALRLGGEQLAVDGIALIGEHGDYPLNEKQQILYPRYDFYQQIVDVMRQDGRTAPIFVDKHFSYSWPKAKEMYESAKELNIPLMAGSTVSLAWREPPLELGRDVELDEALVVGFGPTDGYGFHALEALQAIVERRKGAETGVRSVEAHQGAAVWKLAEQGVWPRKLFDEALSKTASRVPGKPEELVENPVLFRVNYQDGLKASVLICNGLLRSWVFAASKRGSGDIVSTECRIQFYLHGHWGFMARNFEQLVTEHKTPNPVERTLLTTGILAFAIDSLYDGGCEIETPELAIEYEPV